MTAVAVYGPTIRQRKSKEDRPVRPGEVCGTYAAWQQHYLSGERGGQIDEACRHAHDVYIGQWRVRSGRTKNALVPYPLLGALLAAAPTELEERAEELLGDAVITRAVEAAELANANDRDGAE